MEEIVYITGHKNPDSDSICSAIAYADFKNATEDIEAIPVRLGEISRETKFILDYFNIEEPELMETVRLSVEDLDYDKITPISPCISLRMALNIMERNGTNSLPVVNDQEELVGVISTSDIIRRYIDVWDNSILGKSNTTIDNIIDTLSANPLYLGRDLSKDGRILVIAMDPEVVREHVEAGDVAICGNRSDVQKVALESGVSLLIVTGSNSVKDEVYELAKKMNVSLISTPHDTFTAARLITQSIPVSYAMTSENLVHFSEDDLVDDVSMHMSQTRYRSYPVTDHNGRVLGALSRYHLLSSTKKKVILVDHNERTQSVDGLEEAEILEIIDHHRVADVFTGTPIYFRNEPVGSTATIIGSIMFENGRRPSKKIAGILCAAIISDTLLLRSPTATLTDQVMLERLSRIADLDVEDFANKMFKAGTSLTGKTPKEILTQDFKEFTIDSKKIAISQVFTMDLDSLDDMKQNILDAMEKHRKENGYKDLILLLTDIFEEASEVVVVGEHQDIIAGAFGKEIRDNAFYSEGVVSRKKQVVPPITNALTKTKI